MEPIKKMYICMRIVEERNIHLRKYLYWICFDRENQSKTYLNSRNILFKDNGWGIRLNIDWRNIFFNEDSWGKRFQIYWIWGTFILELEEPMFKILKKWRELFLNEKCWGKRFWIDWTMNEEEGSSLNEVEEILVLMRLRK